MRRHTKFGQNRMIGGRDIAIKPKSNTAAAAMLNLLSVYILIYVQDYKDKMRPHTKFCANQSIFREVMMFRIFSRWLPSASLNFEKKSEILDKFSRVELKSASAHQIWSKSDDRWPRYRDTTEIQYGRRRHVEFTSGLHFDILSRLGIQNASAYQISSKSVNISRSYDVLYIFKMASVRHLEL